MIDKTIDHIILTSLVESALKSERKLPDSVEPMRRSYESVKHDAWFREQVQQAVDGADQSNAVFVPHEHVKTAWTIKRTDLLLQAEGGRI